MRPVKSLQHMLNELARTVPAQPGLVETGVFDEPTLEAVMIFQRDGRLPVTGVVDEVTWDAIVGAYYREQFLHGAPPPLRAFPHGEAVFQEGARHPVILLAQAMLLGLRPHLSNFHTGAVDGVNAGDTAGDLRQVQCLAGLPQSGALDRATWAILCRVFEAVVTRHGFVWPAGAEESGSFSPAT